MVSLGYRAGVRLYSSTAAAIDCGVRTAQAAGAVGQLVFSVRISLALTCFDPTETLGIITPLQVALCAARVEGSSSAFGNAATLLQGFVVKGGAMPTAAILISTRCTRRRQRG